MFYFVSHKGLPKFLNCVKYHVHMVKRPLNQIIYQNV